MTSSLAVINSLALGIFASLIAPVVMRSRPATMRTTAALGMEVFVCVIVAFVLTQFPAMPRPHWLGMRLP
ncbi:MAG: hypothetical protein QM692_13020 [Thermomicrobiales bacterium]